MIKCENCNYQETKVIRTLSDKDNQVYRRRECVKCGKRFTTREHVRDDYKYKVRDNNGGKV